MIFYFEMNFHIYIKSKIFKIILKKEAWYAIFCLEDKKNYYSL